jgi:hypothetical protein
MENVLTSEITITCIGNPKLREEILEASDLEESDFEENPIFEIFSKIGENIESFCKKHSLPPPIACQGSYDQGIEENNFVTTPLGKPRGVFGLNRYGFRKTIPATLPIKLGNFTGIRD